MTDTPCLLCHHPLAPTELRTCTRCLGLVRRHLRTISQLHRMLPHLIGLLPAPVVGFKAKGADTPLPGGDLLVMLGPGSPAGEGQADDAPAVAFELWQWAVDWAEIRGEPQPPTPGVPEAVGWLSTRAGWAAAHHDAFDEFAADLARIVRHLETATGLSDRPEVGPPCPYCRTASLLRYVTDQGFSDDWTCPACRRDFSYAQYVLALRAAVEDAIGREAG
jgi:hypothetical protein